MSKADKKEEKKTKRQKKAEALEEFRRREGFIPYYSDTFFDRIHHFRYSYTTLILFVIFMVEIKIVISTNLKVSTTFITTFCLIFVYTKLRNIVEVRMEHFGYQIEDDALIRTAWGRRKAIPYTEIRNTVMTEPVKMTIKEIKIPSPYGYISFPYEVGNAKQQKHIRECYDIFKCKVNYELPPMMIKNISHFDRMYTYNITFRNCCLLLCLAEVFLFGCNLGNDSELVNFVGYMIPLGMQCIGLDKMAKSIRLGMTNAKELEQSLTKYPRTTYKIKYRKNWQFLLVAGMVIVLNFLTIWYCWKLNW